MKKWIIKFFPRAAEISLLAISPDGASYLNSFSHDELFSGAGNADAGHDVLAPVIECLNFINRISGHAKLPPLELYIQREEEGEGKLPEPLLMLHTASASPLTMPAPFLTIQVPETIDEQGLVRRRLEESAMNVILRQVYRFPTASVIIALENSSRNPLHERNLHNLIKTAGYKVLYQSHRTEHFLFLYSHYPELREHFKKGMEDFLFLLKTRLTKGSEVIIDF